MIATVISELGPWSWWIFGLILLGLEILVPGVFLLWIGFAALVIGAVSFFLWDSAIWGWQVQWLSFAVLALVFALAGRRVMEARAEDSDHPMLNRRMDGLIGRTATLEEPIREGRGRIRLDDTFWMVRGPDLPAGTRVRVTTHAERDLTVEQSS